MMSDSKILASQGGFSLEYADGDYFVFSERTGLVIWEGDTLENGMAVLKDPAKQLAEFPPDLY